MSRKINYIFPPSTCALIVRIKAPAQMITKIVPKMTSGLFEPALMLKTLKIDIIDEWITLF